MWKRLTTRCINQGVVNPSEVFKEALGLFPGGVNSPVRAMKHLPMPIIVKRAEGAYLYTIDGRRLIDYCMGFGPLILGHRHPAVLEAVREALNDGWLYGALTEREVELAKEITSNIKSIEMIRFVNTGTEAVMNAVRLARGFTGRRYIVKFEGNYHGAFDYVLVKAGSGAATWGVPTSAGILEEAAKYTLVVPYNDVEALERVFREYGNEIALLLVEPIAGNYGLIIPDQVFIKATRELTERYGALLLFDEVITGFRVGLSGAQGMFNIKPDLTTLGKIIGGGFPIGAFGGRRDVMSMVTPQGPVYNAGTFNAHPISMAAGLATLRVIEGGGVYEVANEAAERVAKAIEDSASRNGFDIVVKQVASMFQFYFKRGDVRTPSDVRASDEKLYLAFHREALNRGVYFTPSQYEVNFTSAAHTRDIVDETIRVIEESFKALRANKPT